MPLALDPNETTDVVLAVDEDKPAETRPTFCVRYLTSREWLTASKLVRQYDEAETDEQGEPLLDQILAMMIVGWRNITGRDGQPIVYTPGAEGGILTVREKRNLVIRARHAINLSEREKKAYRSSPLSAPAASAPTAPAASNATASAGV
jgi:hypothetical protein